MLSVRFTDERRLALLRGAAARPGPARLLDVEPEPDRMQRAVVLITSRLVLTSWLVDDVESLHEVHSDPETMRFVRNGRPESIDEVWRLVGEYIAEDAARGWTKWRLADLDGQLVGRAGFGGTAERRELGFVIRRDRRGAGLATEIAAALVGWHLANTVDVPLCAIVEVGNNASARVLEKAGFRETGHEDHNGIHCRAFAHPLTPDQEAARGNDLAVLRPYRSADYRSTRAVFAAAITRTAAAYYTPEQVNAWCPASFDHAAWDAARARAWTIVAEQGGDVVGFADLTDDAELDMLFVHPDASRRGVARALVTAVLNEARRRGLNRVTTRASRAARPAFQRFGFVVDRENLDNTVRGVTVPNVDMHIDLAKAWNEAPEQGTERALTRGASAR